MSLQHSGSEIKWVDGGKTLFKVSTHLVSTVYTQVTLQQICEDSCVEIMNHNLNRNLCILQDQHLHNFFHHCQSMEVSEQASEGELVKYLKVS